MADAQIVYKDGAHCVQSWCAILWFPRIGRRAPSTGTKRCAHTDDARTRSAKTKPRWIGLETRERCAGCVHRAGARIPL